METYKIIKFCKNGNNEIIDTGLLLTEAQEYCRRDDTSGDDYFCGYTKE